MLDYWILLIRTCSSISNRSFNTFDYGTLIYRCNITYVHLLTHVVSLSTINLTRLVKLIDYFWIDLTNVKVVVMEAANVVGAELVRYLLHLFYHIKNCLLYTSRLY